MASLRRICAFLLLLYMSLASAGCHWGQPPKPAYVPPPETAAGELSPAETAAAQPPPVEEPSADSPSGGILVEIAPGPSADVQAPLETAARPLLPAPATAAPPAAGTAPPSDAPPPPAPAPGMAARPVTPATAPPNGAKPRALVPYEEPAWARGKEELVYRVEFLGMTMGYARFTFRGKALLGGRETYRLSVRAWTSDFLSVIYPINETIDYYMDVKTLEPLRVEYTGRAKKKDDVASYDQKKGRIVYRYIHNGEIRKEVDAVPSVFDPVTVAYYFRARDLGCEDRPRNVYGGRKLYQISSRLEGREKIDSVRGPLETVVIRPVIKREGRLEDKGDLKMWMTDDARRVPVRIYAKFRKIKMWTLFAELVPPKEGG